MDGIAWMGGSLSLAVEASGSLLAVGVSEGTAIGLYLTYAVTAVALIVFLAKTLYRHGEIFLESSFDEPGLAHVVNKLLVIGFYLLNLGYALLVYQLQPTYDTLTEAFNELVVKLGVLLLSLGVLHLTNMLVFWKIRTSKNRTKYEGARTNLPQPAAFVPPPPSARPSPMGMNRSVAVAPHPVAMNPDVGSPDPSSGLAP